MTNKTNKTNKTKKKNPQKTKRTYKKSEYSSGDGMLTSVWGPSMWHYLHTMSFNYPVTPTDNEKKDYMNFVLSLTKVLPCGHCRDNLKKNFKSFPLLMCNMKNRHTFSLYVYNLHETVNKMLGKKSGLSYTDVRERYEHFRARCTKEKPKMFKFKKTHKREKGCTESLYGSKSKSVIKIVPQETKCETIQIDKKCIKTRNI